MTSAAAPKVPTSVSWKRRSPSAALSISRIVRTSETASAGSSEATALRSTPAASAGSRCVRIATEANGNTMPPLAVNGA